MLLDLVVLDLDLLCKVFNLSLPVQDLKLLLVLLELEELLEVSSNRGPPDERTSCRSFTFFLPLSSSRNVERAEESPRQG